MSHAEAYGEHEEGVQAHARSQCEWLLGIECHYKRTYDCSQGGSGKHRTGRHSGKCAEYAGIDGQDIGHREECSKTRENLGAHIVLLRIKPESFFQEFRHRSDRFRMSSGDLRKDCT